MLHDFKQGQMITNVQAFQGSYLHCIVGYILLFVQDRQRDMGGTKFRLTSKIEVIFK